MKALNLGLILYLPFLYSTYCGWYSRYAPCYSSSSHLQAAKKVASAPASVAKASCGDPSCTVDHSHGGHDHKGHDHGHEHGHDHGTCRFLLLLFNVS
jgi:hypothetical protein